MFWGQNDSFFFFFEEDQCEQTTLMSSAAVPSSNEIEAGSPARHEATVSTTRCRHRQKGSVL